MFRDQTVFDTGHLPDTTRHRNTEMTVIANTVRRVTYAGGVEPVFCHGGSDAGKTTDARTVCEGVSPIRQPIKPRA